ncbi:MAG: exonuclease SbcCD subunit D [Candidatus Melainabacteria bacterium]|nr:exonuclease SbcCD subunit D [Candidatus Melainabacteria bacterium]
MPIQLVHVSDIHFGSGEGHGKINPLTGLNIRFEDFVNALKRVVDYTIDNQVDVFLFSGDAYRNASPEPIYQKMFARELKRLSEAGISTILVVGNHDQILRSTQSHSLSVFQSLEVPGVITVDQPTFETIQTKNGPFQFIGLPHVTRNNLTTLEKYAGFTSAQLDDVLVRHVSDLFHGFYTKLNPEIPTVVSAHMSLDRALAGIEEELLVGYTLTFPADIFIDEKVDYVAMGHIHKYQIIRPQNPAIIYSGSLERVDFGEANEDKGFVHVNLERNNTSYSFHSINPRPFVTVDADLSDLNGDDDATEILGKKVSKAVIPGCVLRIRYRIKQDKVGEVNERKILQLAQDALSVRLQPELIPDKSKARLPQLTEQSATSPLAALELYLSETCCDDKERLLSRAKEIMNELDSSEII